MNELSSIDITRDATGRPLASHWTMLSFLASMRKLASVVDFGCGHGNWLLAARDLGATVLRGYDVPGTPFEGYGLTADEFLARDLTQEIVSERRFDLAICLEVAQQIPAANANTLIDSLCNASDWILFGAALPNQGGTGHVHENWLEYWAGLFADAGLLCYDVLRMKFWNDAGIAYYYRQNTCLYVRPGSDYALKARGYAPSANPTSLVHPEMLMKLAATPPPRRYDPHAELSRYCELGMRNESELQ